MLGDKLEKYKRNIEEKIRECEDNLLTVQNELIALKGENAVIVELIKLYENLSDDTRIIVDKFNSLIEELER